MPQATVEHEQPATRFGTFTGVFTPTLLTILGVIMYVRIGWVVGNAGLGGALIILGLGLLITACTGLSLSSIATNTRMGPGGPYAIMNKSLGLEVGGAIGIPLFLTRPLGVAMYLIGFRAGDLARCFRWQRPKNRLKHTLENGCRFHVSSIPQRLHFVEYDPLPGGV